MFTTNDTPSLSLPKQSRSADLTSARMRLHLEIRVPSTNTSCTGLLDAHNTPCTDTPCTAMAVLAVVHAPQEVSLPRPAPVLLHTGACW